MSKSIDKMSADTKAIYDVLFGETEPCQGCGRPSIEIYMKGAAKISVCERSNCREEVH